MRLPKLSLAVWSLLALVGGLALGMLGHASGAEAFVILKRFLDPLGDLWLSALQLLLLPLIVTNLLAAVTGSGSDAGGELGKLGVRTVALIVVLLLLAGLLTIFLSAPLLALYEVDPSLVASISDGKVTPEAAESARAKGFQLQLPDNLVEAAGKGQIFPLLVFALALGAAVTRLPRERREPLTTLFRSLADAMMIVVRWVLVFTPVAVFALTYSAALSSGGHAAGMMGAFIVMVCVLLFIFVLLMYPLAAVFGRVSLQTFAKAAAPAQLVAVSTLSSIAALPALIQGGRDHLRLPERFTGFLLPLCVSIFKMNRTVSSTAKLMFLAHVFDIPLTPMTFVVFMLSVTLLSFGAVGVPNGGQAFTTLPAYVAAGMPIEGVIVLEATSMAPDMLKTVLNVTADMAVAAILSRSSRSAGVERAPEEDAALVSEGAA